MSVGEENGLPSPEAQMEVGRGGGARCKEDGRKGEFWMEYSEIAPSPFSPLRGEEKLRCSPRSIDSWPPSPPPPSPSGKWTLDFPFIFEEEGEGKGRDSPSSKMAAPPPNLSNILVATSSFTRSN